MLSRQSIHGNRILVSYRLRNIRTWVNGRKKARLPAEKVNFRVKPRTKELVRWLNYKGWGYRRSDGTYSDARAIDNMVRRFWQHWIEPKKLPPQDWSTVMIMDAMLKIMEGGHVGPFLCFELYRWPNKGRLLDYLTAYWYKERGGRKKCY